LLDLKPLVSVLPSVNCQHVIEICSRESYDQLPVIGNGGNVLGVATVGRIVARIVNGDVTLDSCVSDVMYKSFNKVTMDTTLGTLSRLLDSDHFVVVVSQQVVYSGEHSKEYEVAYGIVTRIDLLKLISTGSEK
uniref:CBS domain-containing protein n=1 Tax=Salmonella sp. s54925 TaxID=3159674 RepID=UPI0039818868